ncbi:MAG: potassium/proton antiporter [Oscillospiraceae bacterium]|nr:potassium/proton antiporter [Oscillospiraceae bacterium]
MNIILLLGLILILSVLSCKVTNKIGLPILVGFILIGILVEHLIGFGDLKAHAESLCNFALLFIIFTGGLQTDFKKAKSILGVSILLSALGTVLTAAAAAAFAYFVLNFELYAAILLGAVISCTDAASVFSILSTKKMNLKNNLGGVLEMESGSNDPTAYMLTIVFLSMATGVSQNVSILILMQILIGGGIGVGVGLLGRRMLNRLNLEIEELYAILLCGVALIIYGMSAAFGGNGFLAVYIGGMILGNSNIAHKRMLSRSFGAISMLMQVVLFIILGILFIPGTFRTFAVIGVLFALFLFFIARPLTVFLIMKPFGYKLNEIALVSWAGFRGASSIVFATYLLTQGLPYAETVFSIVFFVCMLSVILQGSLLAPLAKRFNLLEPLEKAENDSDTA